MKNTDTLRSLSVRFYLGKPGTITPPQPDPLPTPIPEPDPGADPDPDPVVDPDPDLVVDPALQKLYFPLFPMVDGDIYLGLINNSEDQDLSGSLNAYDHKGELLATFAVKDLRPRAQREFALVEIFPGQVDETAYVVFVPGSGVSGHGYFRMVDDILGRTASYPALVAPKDCLELDVPNLLYGSGWTTEVAMVSLSKMDMTASIKFNNGASAKVVLNPGGQYKIVIDEDLEVSYNNIPGYLLGEISQPATAATVRISHIFADKNKDLAIGAVLYRNGSTMSSAILQKAGAEKLYVAYMPVADPWWTGLALYNPDRELRTSEAEESCALAFTETVLSGQKFATGDELEDITLDAGKTEIINGNKFTAGTQGLKIESECIVSGVEFMGTGTGMGCIALSEKSSKTGVFVRVQAGIEQNKWSGIALLNPDSHNSATVTLSAYDAKGNFLAEKKHTISALSQLAGLPETFFNDDISAVASIRYSADQELVGLVINHADSRVDGETRSQVDVLPALLFEAAGSTN